ncbi:MAG TPA: hypothetical protein VEX18_12230, partial [Polyangiaceae bacterium]|nr:hypothetical protein [Polyangiaceae bacterium]
MSLPRVKAAVAQTAKKAKPKLAKKTTPKKATPKVAKKAAPTKTAKMNDAVFQKIRSLALAFPDT